MITNDQQQRTGLLAPSSFSVPTEDWQAVIKEEANELRFAFAWLHPSQFVHIFSLYFPAVCAMTCTGRGHATLATPVQALNSCANGTWSMKVQCSYTNYTSLFTIQEFRYVAN